MISRFFRSCSSCNRPPLADWLITACLIVLAGFAVLMAWFLWITIFG
jgi:hypothetical protein